MRDASLIEYQRIINTGMINLFEILKEIKKT